MKMRMPGLRFAEFVDFVEEFFWKFLQNLNNPCNGFRNLYGAVQEPPEIWALLEACPTATMPHGEVLQPLLNLPQIEFLCILRGLILLPHTVKPLGVPRQSRGFT